MRKRQISGYATGRVQWLQDAEATSDEVPKKRVHRNGRMFVALVASSAFRQLEFCV